MDLQACHCALMHASALLSVGVVGTLLFAISHANGSPALDDMKRWCAQDSACYEAYHMSHPGMFEHLVPREYLAWNLSTPLDRIKKMPVDDALKYLWVSTLMLHLQNTGPVCDMDHMAIFNPDTLEQECICRPDRPCGMSTNDSTPLYIVYGLLVVLIVGVFALSVVRTITLVRIHNMATKDRTGVLRVVIAALSG